MLPSSIAGLERLARNLWWCWDTDASALWERIDFGRFHAFRNNPLALLAEVEPARLDELAADPGFVADLETILGRLDAYLAEPGWSATAAPNLKSVAYFCLEFGLHESLRIYSGGLGVLSGDHLKSASDLGVPLTAIGLLYRRGYFRQVIEDGKQLAAYPEADWTRIAPRRMLGDDGTPLVVEVPIANRNVKALVWRLDVGRVALYLLDTDHEGNEPQDRALTYNLYGGDQEVRIKQEMLVGVGGVRVLRALGLQPDVYHLNEGHCAFVALELIRERLAAGDTWDAAISWVRKHQVFTTHTPVPAGHDRFGWDLVDRVLGPWRKSQNLPQGAHIDLGRVRQGDWNETLCMTVLALRTSGLANAVSALHGHVSREMWQPLYPSRQVDDVPITHITNGVHPFFWMAPETRAVFDDYIPHWRTRTWDPEVWAAAENIPDSLLWQLRGTLRKRMVSTIKRRNGQTLDHNALTIGFARRFAPYKRGDMIFGDPERLLALFARTPMQLIYAGKAHPADGEGKKLITNVLKWTQSMRFHGHVAFLEEYDLEVGRALTSGSDVWLNNPRRPHEASGTSGQKVLLNGGLNLSILDGWWAEAWDGTNGWGISSEHVKGPRPADQTLDEPTLDAQDEESLYQLLENEVLPEWTERGHDGVPTAWVRRMKRSIATGVPVFNTHRMVRDYVLDLYSKVGATE